MYDWDGTTSHQLGRAYDWDGTTSHQHSKGYDWDGTTSHLIYTSDFVVYNWGVLDSSVTLSGGHQAWATNLIEQANYVVNSDHIYLVGAGAGSPSNVDNAAWAVFDNVDFTGYNTLTMTYSLDASVAAAPAILGVVDASYDTSALYGAGVPQTSVPYLVKNSAGGATAGNPVTNATISCDVSAISGVKKILAMTYASFYNNGYISRLYIRSIKLT